MMNAKNKMECDSLLETHKRTRNMLGSSADAAMLATLVLMTRDGEDEMAMYMLHNLKPYAIEIAEGGEEEDEPEIDSDVATLLHILLS